MELVKHPVEKLLTVMLSIAFKHRVCLSYGVFQTTRGKADAFRFVPKRVEQLCKSGYDLTLRAHYVVEVYLILESLLKEVVSENIHVAETLKCTIHVACVAKVIQALATVGCHRVNHREIDGVHVNLVKILACLHVVVLIGLSALSTAICYLATGALDL